jgi:nucleoside-diphosphate-sugar epimerase
MKNKKGKVLIIGGCGYIGSKLFQYLTDKKYFIDTVDLEWYGNYVNPRNFKKDYETLPRPFLRKYDSIILLAGHSSIPMCESKMIDSFKNNVFKFLTLLNKIEDQKFIYASSSSVYGNTKKLKITEDYDRYSPTNFYDLTKKEIDYYAQLSKVNYYGLRMGTVCGYSPNLRIDVMINKMIDTALTKKEIVVFNKNFYRPILGINDFCRLVEKILKSKKDHHGLYNVASFNSQIEEIAQKVAKKMGLVGVKNVGVNPGYYSFSINTRKFEKTFGFEFNDSIDSITYSIIRNYPKAKKTIRI